MAEFTGERLIPGEVDQDLLNEHMARYAFAARLARGKRVLDAGCGTGYGSAMLAEVAASVTGMDLAAEAVDFARSHYEAPNLHFEQGSCAALPHGGGVFDLVVAFEVIEHIAQWREFLAEARRVLAPGGQFVVSTPNRLYYTESRGPEGANPFHVHEFDFAEFHGELAGFFPYISMFLENHVEGVAFQPYGSQQTAEVKVDSGEVRPEECHFFIAVCAHRPQLGTPTFVYVPRAANVLRERERHIALLEGELRTKDEWLEKAKDELAALHSEYQKLLALFRGQTAELEARNEWAAGLDRELNAARGRIAELQDDFAREQAAAREMAAAYDAKIAELEEDSRQKAAWAVETERRLTAEIEGRNAELARAAEALQRVDRELEERTAWALDLQREIGRLQGQLAQYQASRWVKLGRRFGLGPELPAV